jgi:hypothetical protein
MVEFTTTIAFKLRDWNGCLLGVLTIPPQVAYEITKERGFRSARVMFHERRFPKYEDYRNFPQISDQAGTYALGELRVSSWNSKDLELIGLTLEQLEQIDGFTFSPSLAYLNKLLMGISPKIASSGTLADNLG